MPVMMRKQGSRWSNVSSFKKVDALLQLVALSTNSLRSITIWNQPALS